MSRPTPSSAIVWTDGSSHETFGGWAALVCLFHEDGEVEKLPYTGYAFSTTNNRMEMQAVISGLEALPEGIETVYVAADSNYVIETLTKKWYLDWSNPAKTRPNWDLWEKLIPLVDQFRVQFIKIKGHSKLEGDYYNELVDKLASEARKAGRVKSLLDMREWRDENGTSRTEP